MKCYMPLTKAGTRRCGEHQPGPLDRKRVRPMSKRTKSTERPFWQARPCPTWCRGGHHAGDAVEDRTHFANWESAVELSLHSADNQYVKKENDHERVAYPADLTVSVRQEYRDVDPTIELYPEAYDPQEPEHLRPASLTMDEAERLGRALLKAARLARGAR